MRFLMKIPIPTAEENPLAGSPEFDDMLKRLLLQIGTKATYSQVISNRRYVYSLIDVEIEQITPTAEPVFRLLGVKPEFLPEVAPKPYYGRTGY